MASIIARQELETIWQAAGGDPAALSSVTLSGQDPVLPSSFAVGALAQASIAACGLAAAEVWRQRTGIAQAVTVDMRHTAIEFRSERYVRTDAPPADLWDKLAGLYRTKDERWVRLHTNFPHHRDGILALLQCANERDAVQAALLSWDGEAFETAAAAHNLVVTLMRSPDEWAAHAQGRAVAALPLFEIVKIGEAPTKSWATGARPLSGLRVLDLTRIIAGPVAGRTLAAHGAEVLHITSPRLPSIASLVIDTGRGKRPAFVDLDTADGRTTLDRLVRDADVFIQGYRPGGLAARGFSPADLAAKRPGIIAVTLSAYGHTGPWAGRRGFDSLTQNANGINSGEASALSANGTVDRPKELPCQALDHGAGYLLAFGAMMARARQATEGGSWHVRTSLAQVGEWLKRLPRVPGGPQCPDPTIEAVQDLIEVTPSGFGPLKAVRHAAKLTATPAHWAAPAMPLGHYPATWC